jgi:O-antigen/teichoic acid export membrane protein
MCLKKARVVITDREMGEQSKVSIVKKISNMSYLKLKPALYFINFFTKGHERSVKAKKNIISSLFIRAIGISISLILVPLTINYVNPSRYGIWLTLSSIVAWFGFFDIGLTQGLRNKFAEAKAVGNDALAQIYVSTTYAVLGIIFFSIWVLFLLVNNHLDWAKILNVPADMQSEISNLALIVFTYFCITFVLKIITTIMLADQEPAKSSLVDIIGQGLSLGIIFILVKTTEGSLIRLGFGLCVSPIIVLLFANLFLFRGRYRKFRPKISKVNLHYAKSLFNLGFIFFLIQFAAIMQFQTANIIIARNFNLSEVTSYNIVFKYFGVLNMVFSIFLLPFWSASTEAYYKNDIQWIRNGIKRYNILNILFIIIGIVMLVFSSTVYRLWLGEGKVNIAFPLSLWGFLYFNVILFGGKYVSLLNGISALRIQFISCTISPFLYIAIALLLIKHFQMGVYSLFIASVIANFNAYLLAPIQYYKIIVQNKKGIWLK